MQRLTVIQCSIGDLSIDSVGYSGSLEKQELAPFMVFMSFSNHSGHYDGVQGLKIALHACAVLMEALLFGATSFRNHCEAGIKMKNIFPCQLYHR